MGERMRCTHDQPHGLARERFEVEVVVLERRGETAEREIHFAAVQQLHHLVAGLAKNADVEQRPFAFKFGDGHGEHVRRRAHDRADGQLTVTAAPLAFEVGGEAREVGQRPACISERGDTERRGLHAACVALEKKEAERFFYVAQHPARAWLGDIDGFGRLMQVAGVVQGDEQRQMLEFQAVDEGDLGDVLVHRASSRVHYAIRFCDRLILTSDCHVISRRLIVVTEKPGFTGFNTYKRQAAMETIAFRMTLKPGQRDEYERRHRDIWPELAETLRDAGVRDYWIFLDEPSGHLFATLKREPGHTMDALPDLPIMRKWWDNMADLMDTNPDRSPVQHALVPVFHLP